MGQNNSQPVSRLPPGEVKRYPPPRPKAPPSSRPLSDLGPRGPSYYNPENKVLPKELPIMKLRPVSMELSKVHPDFADIFNYGQELQTKVSLDNENEDSDSNVSVSNKERVANGHIEKKGDTPEKERKDEDRIDNSTKSSPVQNGHIPGMQKPTPITTSASVEPKAEEISVNHSRTNSLDRNHPRKQGHRRQMSATSSLMTAKHTIFEDPEEYSMENRGKIDPLAQSYPETSLPQKNTFDMDYKFQCTYVQLAEYRRKKHIAELESKKGLKLSDLSADLAENEVTIPIHPLERGSPTRTSTRSTVSMDSGLKKKKRAPPPPGQPPAPPTQNGRPNPGQQQLGYEEPPADYDMDESPFGSPSSGNTFFVAQSAPNTPRGGFRSDVAQSAPNTPRGGFRTGVAQSAPNTPRGGFRSDSLLSSHEGTKHKIPPPPPPPPKKPQSDLAESKRLSTPVRQNSYQKFKETRDSNQQDNSEFNRRSSAPWLDDIKRAAEKRESRLANITHRQQSPSSDTPTPPGGSTRSPSPNQVFDSASVSAETRLASLLAEPRGKANFGRVNQTEPLDMKDSSTSPVQRQISEPSKPTFERQNSSSSLGQVSFDLKRQNSSASLGQSVSLERQNSVSSTKTDPGGPVRRLSSLLQHDIKLAAQAKITTVVKQTTAVKPKPKDPAQVFQETLAKAAAAREERMKDTSIDQQLSITENPGKSKLGTVVSPKEEENTVLLKTDNITVKRKESSKGKSPENADTGRISPQTHPDGDKIYKQRFTKNKEKSASKMAVVRKPRQLTPPSSEDEADKLKQFELPTNTEWAPEHDLDSDDNLSDRETMTTRKSGTSEGFKSSIIPSKVNDLKTKKGKDKKYARKTSDSSDEKNKYGSIKKFQKSVHKGVKNAFGSFSRASGNLLRKGKMEELEQVDDVPKNWTLTASHPVVNGDVRTEPARRDVRSQRVRPDVRSDRVRGDMRSERAQKYMVPNGCSDEDEDEPEVIRYKQDLQRSKVMFQPNGDLSHSSEDESDSEDKADKEYRLMKRAGVAYISGKGQIVVLPEYETVKVDEQGRVISDGDEGHAPKIKQQKKKFNYDATVRKKEREQKEQVLSHEVKENEKKMEDERQKQLMMDLDFQRMREQETRERLHRLEAAQMQQQYNAALTQQHQMTMLSAPPLPPPGGFQGSLNNLPDFQTNPYSAMLGQPGLGMTPGLGMGFSVPGNLNAPLLNGGLPNASYEFNDYLRMLGVQPSSSSQQQHQYAYMLNSANWASQKPSSSLINMLSPEQLKLYAAGRLHEYPMDKGVYQVSQWSGPNVTQATVMQATAVPPSNPAVTEVMSQYQFGANSGQGQLVNSDDFRANPLYTSSDDSDCGDTHPPQTTRRGITTIQVGVHQDAGQDSVGEDVRSSSSPATSGGDPSLPSSPSSMEKVYGPMGFRPMRYSLSEQNYRHESTKDSSSNG